MIRPLAPDDASAASALLTAALGGERDPGDLLDPPKHTHHRVYVDGHTLLGVMEYRVVLDEAELCEIAVAPAARRRGIARALLARLFADAAERGARTLFLEVRRHNAPARALYEGAGFAVIGRRRRYYADGQDAILYARDLPATPTGERP